MTLTWEMIAGIFIGCWLYYQVRIFAVGLRKRIHDRIIEDKREKAMTFLADMDEYQQILRRERYDR